MEKVVNLFIKLALASAIIFLYSTLIGAVIGVLQYYNIVDCVEVSTKRRESCE